MGATVAVDAHRAGRRRATKCRILDNENPGLGCWVGDVFFARFGDVDRSPGR
jgi:hypothetical protein